MNPLKKIRYILADHRAGEAERLAHIIARIHLAGSIDDTIVTKAQWRKIVFLDAVARRSQEIQEEMVEAAGVTVTIDPDELKPQEGDDV